MKVPAQPLRCALARLQPQVADLDAIKRTGWKEQHILVVGANDGRLNTVERDFVRRIGQKLYGYSGGSNG